MTTRRFHGFLDTFYLCHVSRPRHDRVLFQYLARTRGRRILELGAGNLATALRLVRLAGRFHNRGDVVYTGIDLFEARPPARGPSITLKAAYQVLRPSRAAIRLVPGEPYSALRRWANEIGPVDLVIIRRDVDEASLNKAWFYLPRLLHEATGVFQESNAGAADQLALRQVSPEEAASLAALVARRPAA